MPGVGRAGASNLAGAESGRAGGRALDAIDSEGDGLEAVVVTEGSLRDGSGRGEANNGGGGGEELHFDWWLREWC